MTALLSGTLEHSGDLVGGKWSWLALGGPKDRQRRRRPYLRTEHYLKGTIIPR